ncbi:MAG TPA: M43 family zinc metalloprotease [Chitinophagaceae bacterium]|nr:M43 family zinc metalloprotease [Chitinophagaceae bacterium]
MSRVVLLCILLFNAASLLAQKECATTTYQEELIKKHPSLLPDITAANSFTTTTRNEVVMSGPGSPDGLVPVITIPVVVHILYKEQHENISDAQVLSQIDALNAAFSLQHADTSRIPSYFRGLAANTRIEFRLAKVDPKGYATNGIVRKNTWVTMYGIDERIKYSDQGGDDAWDSDKYLNIWVGNLAGGIAGYSSVIGGPKHLDGVTIRYSAFGTTGSVAGPYDKGATAVHEVGHWLGLRHIWGDAYCGDDGVDDTPPQRSANRGCPSGIKQSCGSSPYGDMYMNYMDLTSDGCMLMFTAGQMNRMRSMFAPGGPRNKLLSSNGYNGVAIPAPVAAPEVIIPEVKLLDVYPNPAQSILVVDMKESTELTGHDLQIINQFGQRVKTVKLTQAKTNIHVSGLAKGVYFIRIGRHQQKFMKL